MPKKGDINNPSGKGGFKDNPENSAKGRWSKDTSISYWYNYLIRLSVDDFENFKPELMAQRLAYNSIVEAKDEFNYLKEVTDRTEGKAQQEVKTTNINYDTKDLTDEEIKRINENLNNAY